jgi:hypothetical protein
MPFGQVIPVTGLGPGFPGTISRLADGISSTRRVLPTTANPIYFGQAVTILPQAGGGDYVQSVSDFINGGGIFYPSLFDGVAVRVVGTQVTGYPQNPEVPVLGGYVQGQLASILERGTIPVVVNAGTPASQGQVYLRTVLNAAVPTGVVGGFEASPAASDLFTYAVGTGGANAGQATIPLSSTANIKNGQSVSGAPGIPANAVVQSFVANTSVTLNVNLTEALPGGTVLTFGNLVALPGVVFRSGVLGSMNQADITLLTRQAA